MWLCVFYSIIILIACSLYPIGRPKDVDIYEYEGNTIYIQKGAWISIKEIKKRISKFKQCIINNNHIYKLNNWKIYFFKDTFIWNSVIGVTFPNHKVIYILSFGDWLSLEHELMHAVGYLDGEHMLKYPELGVCYSG